MSRFDYVKYDEKAQGLQETIKARFLALESQIQRLPEGRPKAVAFTKLEEAYMWVGKAIRDEQIVRNGSAELQEERTNS